jgi:hypothetical protein
MILRLTDQWFLNRWMMICKWLWLSQWVKLAFKLESLIQVRLAPTVDAQPPSPSAPPIDPELELALKMSMDLDK